MRLGNVFLALAAATGLAAASLSISLAAVPAPQPGTLARYDVTGTYVSGLSSGGFMANQLHVAYSGVFQGAGIFSAGPYDCAQNNLTTALNACMDTYQPRKTPAELEQLTRTRASAGTVDPPANLSGDPVWLFHGSADQTVARAVNDDLATYYRDFGARVAYDNTSAAGHAWVSPIGPNSCGSTASPYVNNCGTADPVREMLGHLFGSVAAPASSLTGKLVQFDQGRYAPGGNAAAISLGRDGFAYVPRACETGPCKLMVTLHGCYQYHGLVGNALMDKGYLNEYADTNRMIVLYPQATTMTGNPRGVLGLVGLPVRVVPAEVRSADGRRRGDGEGADQRADADHDHHHVTRVGVRHREQLRAHHRRPRLREPGTDLRAGLQPGARAVEHVRHQQRPAERAELLGEVLTRRREGWKALTERSRSRGALARFRP
ncbi:extracellular catalytic domain type 2 short-chain-length polyhydroxyalkanoate depolymerase [Lentzea chajnantorensis]